MSFFIKNRVLERNLGRKSKRFFDHFYISRLFSILWLILVNKFKVFNHFFNPNLLTFVHHPINRYRMSLGNNLTQSSKHDFVVYQFYSFSWLIITLAIWRTSHSSYMTMFFFVRLKFTRSLHSSLEIIKSNLVVAGVKRI